MFYMEFVSVYIDSYLSYLFLLVLCEVQITI